MNNYNALMNSHFKGQPLLATMPDPHQGTTISIFYIDSDTEVGLSDQKSGWIGYVGTCCLGIDLVKKIAAYKDNPSSFQSTSRRRVLVEDIPIATRRPPPPTTRPLERRRVHVE